MEDTDHIKTTVTIPKANLTIKKQKRYKLSDTERDFERYVEAKGGYLIRNGWPDFIMKLDGTFYFVEVKGRGDKIRPAQKTMFSLLEQFGIHVFIWDIQKPDVLTPWRKSQRNK